MHLVKAQRINFFFSSLLSGRLLLTFINSFAGEKKSTYYSNNETFGKYFSPSFSVFFSLSFECMRTNKYKHIYAWSSIVNTMNCQQTISVQKLWYELISCPGVCNQAKLNHKMKWSCALYRNNRDEWNNSEQFYNLRPISWVNVIYLVGVSLWRM